ncbi:MAG: Crp/Fnr family transcriptional regulator [Candidatus Eremiobacteraeota bacterium]|nr:Crp/Fnr family transcriptional regulator [Candidatus Eremiobacteraeota bacterium]
MTTVAFTSGNRVLDALPPRDLAGIEDDLEIVTLAAHQFTHSVGGTMHHVDFPIDAVLSVVATLANGDSVEVGTVGCESFVEADAALASAVSSRTSFCQVRGRVGRMRIDRFEQRMATSVPFARLIRHNVRATLFSAQQFVACNVKHSVLQRCARWFAMTADRVGSPQFTLTHDFLAIMLGVRRAGVSEAADALSRLGAIEYRRGVVTVLDRQILESAACECYDACRRAFAMSLSS